MTSTKTNTRSSERVPQQHSVRHRLLSSISHHAQHESNQVKLIARIQRNTHTHAHSLTFALPTVQTPRNFVTYSPSTTHAPHTSLFPPPFLPKIGYAHLEKLSANARTAPVLVSVPKRYSTRGNVTSSCLCVISADSVTTPVTGSTSNSVVFAPSREY